MRALFDVVRYDCVTRYRLSIIIIKALTFQLKKRRFMYATVLSELLIYQEVHWSFFLQVFSDLVIKLKDLAISERNSRYAHLPYGKSSFNTKVFYSRVHQDFCDVFPSRKWRQKMHTIRWQIKILKKKVPLTGFEPTISRSTTTDAGDAIHHGTITQTSLLYLTLSSYSALGRQGGVAVWERQSEVMYHNHDLRD